MKKKTLEAVLQPQRLFLLMVFLVLYGQFLLKYGWNYRNITDIDLPSFYTASVSVFKLGESPYDTKHMQGLMGQDEEVFPYLYPPPSLLFFYPLSALTYPQAHQVVLLINHLLFLALVWAIPLYLVRPRPGYRAMMITLCLIISLTFFPVFSTLAHGQVNFLLLAFLVLFWVLDRRENTVLAALFLALAILLKTYPLLLLPMLLLIGRWRECVYTLAWLGLWLSISLLVLPEALWHTWLTVVLPTGGYASTSIGLFSPADISNHGLNGFFARTFMENEWSQPLAVAPELARLLAYTAALLVVAITALTVWQQRGRADSFDRMMLVSLPAMYLIAPFSWEHHLVYMLPVIFMLPNVRSSFVSLPALALLLLWLASTALLGLPDFFEYKFYAVIVLWALCLFTVWNKDVDLRNINPPGETQGAF